MIDSGITRRTKPLVDLFNNHLLVDQAFAKQFREILIAANERAITGLMKSDVELLASSIKSIGTFQLEWMQAMIIPELRNAWEELLATNRAYMETMWSRWWWLLLMLCSGSYKLDKYCPAKSVECHLADLEFTESFINNLIKPIGRPASIGMILGNVRLIDIHSTLPCISITGKQQGESVFPYGRETIIAAAVDTQTEIRNLLPFFLLVINGYAENIEVARTQ